MTDTSDTDRTASVGGNHGIFDATDRLTILALAALLIFGAAAFYWLMASLGLLDFPPPGHNEGGEYWSYFLTALDFRERRLTLILTYRTFVTTLGFVVGMVLAAIGGLFVLRRARAPLAIDASGRADPMDPGRGLRLTLATTSPGIVFALAGIIVMFFTQFMALPVGAPELFPGAASVRCLDGQLEAGTCSLENVPAAVSSASGLDAYCAARPDDRNCAAIRRSLYGETE